MTKMAEPCYQVGIPGRLRYVNGRAVIELQGTTLTIDVGSAHKLTTTIPEALSGERVVLILAFPDVPARDYGDYGDERE